MQHADLSALTRSPAPELNINSGLGPVTTPPPHPGHISRHHCCRVFQGFYSFQKSVCWFWVRKTQMTRNDSICQDLKIQELSYNKYFICSTLNVSLWQPFSDSFVLSVLTEDWRLIIRTCGQRNEILAWPAWSMPWWGLLGYQSPGKISNRQFA